MESVTQEKLLGLPTLSVVRFLRLPADVLVGIYTDWLEVHRLVRLDSAICSRQDRQEWMELLRKKSVLKSVKLGGYKRHKLLLWLESRNVRTSHLDLIGPNTYSVDFACALDNWLKMPGSDLQSVFFKRCEVHTVGCISSHSRNLRKLDLCDILTSHLNGYWDILRANNNIKELTIDTSYNCTCKEIPEDICLPSVVTLSVYMGIFHNKEVFMDFISRFPCIRCLTLKQYSAFRFKFGEIDKSVLLATLTDLTDIYLK